MNLRLKIESYKKGIALSTGYSVVAQVIGFLKNIIIAYYFGASTGADVFFYGSFLMLSISNWITCFDVPVVIPQMMRMRFNVSEMAAMRFANVFLYLFVTVGIIIASLAVFFTNPMFSLLSNFNADTIAQYRNILLLLVLLCVFQSVVKYLTNVLSAYKHFTMPQIVNMLNNILIISCIVLFIGKIGLYAIVLGTISGYVFNTVILILIMCRSLNWNFGISFGGFNKKLFVNALAAIGSDLFSLVSSFTPRYLFTGFTNGTLASMEYGRRTAEMPSTLISWQFSIVSGVKYNELASKSAYDTLAKVYEKTANLLLAVYVPLTVYFCVFRTEIISLIYKRGKFDADSVVTTALFLMIFALGMPSNSLNTLVTRLVHSLQKNVYGSAYSIIFNSVSAGFLFLAIKSYGLSGFLYGKIATYFMHLAGMGILVRLLLKRRSYIYVIKRLAVYILSVIPACLALLWGKSIMRSLPNYLTLIMGLLFLGAFALLANKVFKLNSDIDNIIRYFLTNIRKRACYKGNV